MAYRLDKFVWCVRLTKTRSLASEAVSKGKVKLNNQVVPAAGLLSIVQNQRVHPLGG